MFANINELRTHITAKHFAEPEKQGWGKENFPYPKGEAFIEYDEMKCFGYAIC
jgi:hypothetical protein